MRGGGIAVVFAIMLGLWSTLGVARAQDATPEACASTTEEENTALVTRLYTALDAGEDIAPLFAPEFVIHVPTTGEAMTTTTPTWLTDRQSDFPDLAVTLERIIAQDDLVSVYVAWSGTQQGADETLGVPATGQSAEWVGTAFFRIECGAIAEIWPVGDNLGLLMDLGVITADELQSATTMATPTS
jgi:predicted ester cyclase